MNPEAFAGEMDPGEAPKSLTHQQLPSTRMPLLATHRWMGTPDSGASSGTGAPRTSPPCLREAHPGVLRLPGGGPLHPAQPVLQLLPLHLWV